MLAAGCGGLRHCGRNCLVAGSWAAAPDATTTDGSTSGRRPLLSACGPLAIGRIRRKTATAAPAPSPRPGHEHPLMPVIRWARNGLGNIERIHDYSTTLESRRIGGKLSDYQFMFVKLRQKPFSVYMRFLKPDDSTARKSSTSRDRTMAGMWRTASDCRHVLGLFRCKPDGPFAMRASVIR